MISAILLVFTVAFANGMTTPIRRDGPQCPPNNLIGSPLTASSTSADTISCTYNSDLSPCTYFIDGGFQSGSSNCPHNIDSSTTSATITNFLCLAFDDNLSAGKDGSPLTSAFNSTGVLICNFQDNNMCTYSQSNGASDSNPGDCPKSANPVGFSSNGFSCLTVDIPGSPLIGTSLTTAGDLACSYADGNLCTYLDGGFDSGSSDCPTSLSGSGNGSVSTSTSSSGSGLSGIIMCLQQDNAGSNLISAEVTPDSLFSCHYADGNTCMYFGANGEFNSGSSTCPPSIAPGSGPIGSGVGLGLAGAIAKGGDSLLATSDAATSDNGSSGNSNGAIPQPILIALLAMNGFLVIGVIVIAGVSISDRRSASNTKLRPFSTGTGYKDVESVSVPLTHGSDEGKYYDPQPSRPPSRM
ncbi:hypothetical protein B0H10DRAFT_2215951 [Mycena sp. CBHHK59/15]|nr:hypothetical protein B0H10DRAFT_2215951 [Mycena sp. CBHHK59/15]